MPFCLVVRLGGGSVRSLRTQQRVNNRCQQTPYGGRHRDVVDPIEVLAAFGGFETAVMVGVMLMAASKRHLLMIDGIAACAALMPSTG